MIGAKLGPYEIVAAIGAGGMGEVYRARDTRLGRDVALKVLPEAMARDAERMARMRREAQVLASLNHPNIAAIYGFEDSGNTHALVMELVEGPTLAEKIFGATKGSVAAGFSPASGGKSGATGSGSRAGLALDEALPLAKQICEAIEYAHERGIIHRDLKPSNVKVTPEGQAKVLDFGLAKAIEGDAETATIDNSPTLSAMATHAGFLLGTAAYMSPEQARGKKADRRADIWAFGVVLFEMLAGQRLFTGETTSDTLAAVIRAEPDWNELPEQTPWRVRELLQRCLKKDPRQRLQSIGDARIALDEYLANPSATDVGATLGSPWAGQAPPLQSAWRRILPWAATAAAIVVAISAGIGWWRAARPISHSMVRIDAALVTEPNHSYRLDDTTFLSEKEPGNSLAISPDGKRLAVEILDADGAWRIAVRNLDEEQFKPLAGTENPASPFFSPDGQWIAFFGDGKLRKIPVEGGAPITLCHAGLFAWGDWGDDGNIIFSDISSGLQQIPSVGGAPAPVQGSKPGDLDPQTLPGSGTVLFTSYTGSFDDANIEVLSLKTHERKMLVQGGIGGRYVAAVNGAGYLIYEHQRTIFAAPFDLDKLAVTGTAQAMLDDLSALGAPYGQFDISRSGTLVYFSGKDEPKRAIFWLDQSGKPQPLHPEPGFYNGMRFSPDGKHLVFEMLNNGNSQSEPWVQDLARNTSVPLTSLPGTSSPVWFPDGAHIAFEHEGGIFWIRADGVGEPQELVKPVQFERPDSFSPDGKWLAMSAGNPFTTVTVSAAPFNGTADRPQIGEPRALLQASGFPMPAFSPDGRWIAYASAETGTSEIYVQPFPGPGGKVAVSTASGYFPAWSHASRELFYLGRDSHIRVVNYAVSGNSFSPGTPRVWSPQQILFVGGPFQPYALSPDGKRFAVLLYPDGTTENHNTLSLTFLLNFADELSRRLPSQ